MMRVRIDTSLTVTIGDALILLKTFVLDRLTL